MNVSDHIKLVDTREEYRGDDPSVPETWDNYRVFECDHDGCDRTYTLACGLPVSAELNGVVSDHLKSEHPAEVPAGGGA